MPEVMDEWAVIDRWWSNEPVRHEWVEARWGDRLVVMVLRHGERVWRVHRGRVRRGNALGLP